MSDSQPESNPPSAQSFWSTLPGVLTAVGGLIAGAAALLTALVSAGVLGNKPTSSPVPVVVATAPPTATAFVPEPTVTTRAITPQRDRRFLAQRCAVGYHASACQQCTTDGG